MVDDPQQQTHRPELLELAVGYAEQSVIVTTSNLDEPGPQIVYANAACERLMGYPIAEILGKTPRMFQGPNTDRATLDRLRSELSAGKDFIGRTRNYRRDGEEFELEWIISHIRDEHGDTTHYIAIQRDISGSEFAQRELQHRDQELRETSTELLRTLKELRLAQRQVIHQQRFAALGMMAAGVVHDLNNALTPMVHVLDLLKTSSDLEENVRGGLQTLEASMGHLEQLVRNLHMFYYSGEDERHEVVELQDLLSDIREVTAAKWEIESRAKGAVIQFELDLDDAASVRGNPTEIRQVVVNFIFNAVDAMPNGGQLTVRLESDEIRVAIEVEDTGAGLSDAALARCFEPYFSSKPDGAGLGLSVCYGIAARHHGQVAAERSPKGGALFRLTLPLAKEIDGS